MTSRVVPVPNVPISGLTELHAHILQLVDDPSLPLNDKLFDDVELQITDENLPPVLSAFIRPLTAILHTTTQDPTPCISLAIKLLGPVPLTRCLVYADEAALRSLLHSPLPGANLLAICILHKASHSPNDAGILSTLPELVREFVETWMTTENVLVAEKAGRVLGDILDMDCPILPRSATTNGAVNGSVDGDAPRRVRPPGQSYIWNRVFADYFVTNVITESCAPSRDRTNNQVTLSQGRLLRLLPRLCTLDIRPLINATEPNLYPATPGSQRGILAWAALAMVDREDVLMHLNLIDFFETLVSVMRVCERRNEEVDGAFKELIKTAVAEDGELLVALRGLPDRTVEEEAEPLRAYIEELLA